jgi:hypothetical protein
MSTRLTIKDAVAIARRGKKLLRQGKITAKTYVVLDCLLWSCRDPHSGTIRVSYTALMRLCHAARDTIARALATLQRLGVLSRIKSRVRIAWLSGVTASRQAVNRYVLHAASAESDQRTVMRSESVRIGPSALAIEVAVGGLERVRGWMEKRLLMKKAIGAGEAERIYLR